LVVATVGATLWATGFFDSATTRQQGNAQALNADQSGDKSTSKTQASEPSDTSAGPGVSSEPKPQQTPPK
jgi:hypothetical protein